MNKILEGIKSLGEKWKGIDTTRKISIILLSAAIISLVIIVLAYFNRVNYATLFSNLEPQDSAKIYEKLKTENIPVKVQGNTILVPEDSVEELRMSVLSEGIGPSSGTGWELFDQGKFGVTDTEARIMHQRALEGELSRTISSFEQVERAIVHLVLPDESVFAREIEKARASITLKLSLGKNLNPEQVKAIVSLVSGSVKNLPKENVEVVDTNMNMLSENLFDTNTPGGTTSTDKQRGIEEEFEIGLQDDVKEMLGSVFGRDRITVKVNADLDFDSRQVTTIKYDPNPIVVSTRKLKESAKDSSGGNSGTSPIDSEYTPSIPDEDGQSSDSTREEETTNYNVGSTEETVIKAPGEVRRMTVSVVIDDPNLTENDREALQEIVATATGYDETRGDKVSILAMSFSADLNNDIEKDRKIIEELEKKEKKTRLYTNIAYGVGGAVLLFVLILLLIKSTRKSSKAVKPNLDVVIGETIIPKQPIAYNPVLDDVEEKMDISHEIKNYANKKPDQVVDMIRTWLSEDER